MSKIPSEKRDFHQILLEKMAILTDSTSEKHDFQSEKPGFQSELERITPQIIHFKARAPKSYTVSFHSRTRPIQGKSTVKPLAQERIYKVLDLSPTGQITLLSLGFTVTNNTQVRLSEVKKAFRRMARTLHPDLNPTTDGVEFTSLKSATDALLAELKNLKST